MSTYMGTEKIRGIWCHAVAQGRVGGGGAARKCCPCAGTGPWIILDDDYCQKHDMSQSLRLGFRVSYD